MDPKAREGVTELAESSPLLLFYTWCAANDVFFCHSDDAVAISTATEWIKEQEVAKDNKIKHTAQGERVRKKRFFILTEWMRNNVNVLQERDYEYNMNKVARETVTET